MRKSRSLKHAIRIKTSVLVLIAAAVSLSARSYTIEKLLGVVVKNSRLLRTIELEIENADMVVQITMSDAMPKVSSSVNITHSNPYYYYNYIDQNNLNSSIQHVISDSLTGVLSSELMSDAGALMRKSAVFLGELMQVPSNTASATVSVAQPIYAQGKIYNGIKLAKAHQRTLLCKHYQEKMKIKADVTILFYNSLLAQKNVEIATEGVSLADETHRVAVVTHAVGNASELDTLISRLNLENARIELKKAQSALRVSYETLITKTGIAESSATFSVEGEFPPAIFEMPLEEVVNTMRKSNPSLEQLRGKSDIQNLRVEIAKGDFFPNVFAGATVGKIGQFDGLNDFYRINWGNDSRIYLGLTWNLFTGLSRNHRLRQSLNDRTMFQLAEQQTIEDLDLQTRNAYEQVSTSRDHLEVSKNVISLAEKSYTIAKKAYEIGSKSLLDLQNAEFRLNQARIELNMALFKFHSAVINLKFLMGQL